MAGLPGVCKPRAVGQFDGVSFRFKRRQANDRPKDFLLVCPRRHGEIFNDGGFNKKTFGKFPRRVESVASGKNCGSVIFRALKFEMRGERGI